LATKRTLLLTWAGLAPAGSHQLCLAHSFNHLVGVLQKVQRQGEAQSLRGLEINDEFETRRLPNRQVGGLLTPEYASSIDSCFSPDFVYDPCCNSSGRRQ